MRLSFRPLLALAPLTLLACAAVPLETDEAEPIATAESAVLLPGGWRLRANDAVGHALIGARSAGRPVDFDGDRRADLIVKGADGFGVLGIDDAEALHTIAKYPRGTIVPGGWYLDASDRWFTGHFTGASAADIVARGPWGMGLLSHDAAGALVVRSTLAFGTTVAGHTLDGASLDYVVTDVDGNGRDEIVLPQPWGFAVLSFTPDGAVTPMTPIAWGASIEGYTVESNSRVRWTGDFDGDGAGDLLVEGAWSWAIIGYRSGAPSLVWSASLGKDLGSGYKLTSGEVAGVGDMDGNGTEDIVVWSNGWVGGFTSTMGALVVLGMDNALTMPRFPAFRRTIHTLAMTKINTYAGAWLHGASDRVRGVADIDGDSYPDILLSNDSAIGALSLGPSGLTSIAARGYGTWPGGWTLASGAQIGIAGTYQQRDRTSFLVRSETGLAFVGIRGGAFYSSSVGSFDPAM
jgi:hypothetical protein